jgi:hypothetical protein
VLDRAAWGAVMAFLRDGTGDVVTSLSQDPEDFPGWQLAWEAQAWRPTVQNPAEPWDELEGRWQGLSDDARWELGMTALNGDPTRQWHPLRNFIQHRRIRALRQENEQAGTQRLPVGVAQDLVRGMRATSRHSRIRQGRCLVTGRLGARRVSGKSRARAAYRQVQRNHDIEAGGSCRTGPQVGMGVGFRVTRIASAQC